MSAVRVELDNLSSEEIECDNDIEFNFNVANTSEADVDYCEPENTSSSLALPGKSHFPFLRSVLVTTLIK